MKKRASKYCLKGCDRIGCYDTQESRYIDGTKSLVWISHCKKRDTIHQRAKAHMNHKEGI